MRSRRGAARRIVIDVRGGEAGNLVRTVPVHVVTVNGALPGAAIVGLDEAATESSG